MIWAGLASMHNNKRKDHNKPEGPRKPPPLPFHIKLMFSAFPRGGASTIRRERHTRYNLNLTIFISLEKQQFVWRLTDGIPPSFLLAGRPLLLFATRQGHISNVTTGMLVWIFHACPLLARTPAAMISSSFWRCFPLLRLCYNMRCGANEREGTDEPTWHALHISRHPTLMWQRAWKKSGAWIARLST